MASPQSGHFLTGCFAVLAVVSCSSNVSAQLTPSQLLATSYEQPDANRSAELLEAIASFNAGDSEAARALLVSARAEHPELAPADVLLALLHFSQNQRAQGEAALDRAILNDPGDPEAFVIIADLAMRERHTAIAQLAYERAESTLAEFEGNDWRKRVLHIRVHAGMASLEESRGRHMEAVRQIEKWAILDPDNPLVHGSLGRELFRSEDYVGARAAFTRLQELQPDAPPVEIAMGRLYTEAGMLEQAIVSMQQAVEDHGEDLRTRMTVAEWAIDRGLVELARENVDAALALEEESFGVYVLQARISRIEGDVGSAESVLTSAILKYPNSMSIVNELARTLALSEDVVRRRTGLDYAHRNYQIARDRGSSSGREAILTYAWLLLKNDQAEQAESVLHTLPDGSTVSSENAYYAGAIYAARNRSQLAAQTLTAALDNDVPFPGRDAAEELLEQLTLDAASR